MQSPAVVHFGPEPRSVEMREFSRPSPGPSEAVIKVKAVGVCGSDLHQWLGAHSWAVNYPVVLGHEFCGTIDEVGGDPGNWKEGDLVVSETAAVVNPDSPMTRRGLYNLDPDRKGFGYGVDGAMTRYVLAPLRCLHQVPPGLKPEHAALTEPCCVAYNAVINNSRITPGCRVLVIGPGPIGLLCASMARLAGAEVAVAGLEADLTRLDTAELIGCHSIIGDPTDWAREGDGLGVDVVIDAAGVSATLETALDVVRPAGWITKVGWGPQPLGISLDPLVQKNVTLQGSFSHNWPIWERVLELLASGRLSLTPILGGVWPLEEWLEAFETMHSGRIAKAVLKPAT
ncbi:MAG: Zn-dependent alcohol dehydrogenase [Verrucomicrobia bacterium]|nr:MAG: Zn-dependent alcohol dehydrogenase [Verrucomicrobiota bacterium]